MWVVISGEGKVTINDQVSTVKAHSIVEVPQGAKHRIENTHNIDDLVFIETQLGTYFGEDDIIRYEDDYGRHRKNWSTSYNLKWDDEEDLL